MPETTEKPESHGKLDPRDELIRDADNLIRELSRIARQSIDAAVVQYFTRRNELMGDKR